MVYEVVEQLGIPFERLDHDVANNIEECYEIEQILDIPTYKNLFLCNKQETEFYLLMMPGDKSFKSGEVSKQVESSRLSFASKEYMGKYLNLIPGSISILGLINDIDKFIPHKKHILIYVKI